MYVIKMYGKLTYHVVVNHVVVNFRFYMYFLGLKSI